MADNERNTPIQDPENLENEILEPTAPAEEAPAEEIPVEEAPAEETPVEEAPVEEAPVEEAPVEEAPVEEAPAEEVPAEEAPVEETPAEEAPVEKAPAEETPAEEAPAEEIPVEEAPAEETPVEEAPVEEAPVEEAPVEEAPVEEVPVEEVLAEETPAEEAPAEEAPVEEAPAEELVAEEPVAEEPAEDITEESTEEAAEETVEEEEFGRFEIGFDDDGNIYLKNGDGESENLDDDEDSDDQAEADEPFDESEEIDPEDLIIYDDVVEEIKAEGARLKNDEFALYSYVKHSREAIRGFESALKTAQRAVDTNKDANIAPSLLAAVIKISGKILEIKCNNLENFVRVKAHDYIKGAKTSLHEEIERYNDYVIEYASITGEQLTRLSTFLPENIASGKSLAVVPELKYYERYVQMLPDEKLSREEELTTMPIPPMLSAEDRVENFKRPHNHISCWFYKLKVKFLQHRLNRKCAKVKKQSIKLNTLRKKYENELQSLEAKTPVADRTGEIYKDKVFAVKVKYGKQLAGITTLKTKNAFSRARLSLTVNRMALEREKLILAYEYMRVMYREGSYSQRKAAERNFSKAITSYNQCAEITSKATGTHFDQLPAALIEVACRGEEIKFPIIAYKRELVEKVGDQLRRISVAVVEDLAPDEESYSENSAKILDKTTKIKNTNQLSDESAIVDRASAVARVMLESLKDSADLVITADELEQFEVKCRRAIRYFKRARKATERAIAKAYDENGVITALIENLRVISNLIEVRRISIAVYTKLTRGYKAREHGQALYKLIDLYNGRAIDYMSIVGEQFSRITLGSAKQLADSADKLKVPVITYKDNYIEVFPKDPLKDKTYEKPRLWRSGIYTPLMMQHYRLTENRAVETTVINAPFVFDVMIDDIPAVSWWHPVGLLQHLFVWAQPIVAWWNRVYVNAEIWFVDESLMFSKSGLKGRQNRNDKKHRRYERKLKRLNDWRDASILALETVVHESDRQSASYQKKLYAINKKFSRKVYKLKLKFTKDCTGRTAARLMLERLVLERERITGMNKILLKYRSYGRITFTPNVLVRYKKEFIRAIEEHNNTAEKLSEMIGIKFSQISTSVADEIIRYGKMLKFPEVVCCREIIETVDGHDRTVGDKWHGYGLYTGTSGSAKVNGQAPIMSVGAMGYATDMGVPFLKADFDGMTMLGMTPGGVPLIGFSATGETSIPFTGTPMMLSGTDGSIVLDAGVMGGESLKLGATNVTDPYSGINRRGVDSPYTDDAEDDAKDQNFGCNTETPLDIEAKMVHERFTRALRARSMTSIDNVANWWKLLGSEINVWLMRKFTFRAKGFLRHLVPRDDYYLELINKKVTATDTVALRRIARVGSIIDIECKRLYSATKTGVRRSQRVWSAWLHEDIQFYNELVKAFNANHERHMHIELLSLTIPDTIIFRKTDRPPAPPIFSLRNRVKLDESNPTLTTDEIYNNLIDYAISSAPKYRGFLGQLWAKWITIPRIKFFDKIKNRGKALKLATRVIMKRSARTYMRRLDNEHRYYRIRYEKARSMRRYNKNTLRAVGVAGEPIKYQKRVHKVLRNYLARNFRIDYNMRIRQIIYRALRIDATLYLTVTLAFAVVLIVAGLFMPGMPALQYLAIAGLVWAFLPIILLSIRIEYDIIMLVASVLLLLTRNIWLIRYGARDVERNRYGITLDCFVSEQYRLLAACEKLRQKPKSTKAKKFLISTVNDYNKRAEIFSEMLRIPIRTIETTSLIDKLVSKEPQLLTEIQNFVYIRELVERVDTHEVGKTLSDRELGYMVSEINDVINSINLAGADNQVAVDFLEGAMKRLISFLQTGIKPTQNERYELKRDLIQGISQFNIGEGRKELFAKNVITVVDQLGGKDCRRIIGVLAKDDMII